MLQIISQNRWLPGKNPAVTKSVQRELRNLLKKVYLIEKENATESFVDIWHLIFRGCWCNQEAESPPPASITYPLSLGGYFHLIKSVPAKIKHPHPKSHALGRKSPSIMEKR